MKKTSDKLQIKVILHNTNSLKPSESSKTTKLLETVSAKRNLRRHDVQIKCDIYPGTENVKSREV
jgi:hypothetical protein